MPEIDLKGFQLLELQALQKIAEGRGSAQQRLSRIRLYLVQRDIRRALADKEAEAGKE
jgi:hypothetical protein